MSFRMREYVIKKESIFAIIHSSLSSFARYCSVSVQFSSVAQSCPTLCDPMNRSTARPPCPSPTPGV